MMHMCTVVLLHVIISRILLSGGNLKSRLWIGGIKLESYTTFWLPLICELLLLCYESNDAFNNYVHTMNVAAAA